MVAHRLPRERCSSTSAPEAVAAIRAPRRASAQRRVSSGHAFATDTKPQDHCGLTMMCGANDPREGGLGRPSGSPSGLLPEGGLTSGSATRRPAPRWGRTPGITTPASARGAAHPGLRRAPHGAPRPRGRGTSGSPRVVPRRPRRSRGVCTSGRGFESRRMALSTRPGSLGEVWCAYQRRSAICFRVFEKLVRLLLP